MYGTWVCIAQDPPGALRELFECCSSAVGVLYGDQTRRGAVGLGRHAYRLRKIIEGDRPFLAYAPTLHGRNVVQKCAR